MFISLKNSRKNFFFFTTFALQKRLYENFYMKYL